MTVEFALRPRIRLREDFAAAPRRRRLRLPRLALPVLAYWLTVGGITYTLSHARDPSTGSLAEAQPSAPEEQPAPAAEQTPPPAVASAPPISAGASEPEQPLLPPLPPLEEPRAAAAALGTSILAAPAGPREERARAVPATRDPESQTDDAFPALLAAPEVEPSLQPRLARSVAQAGGTLPSCEAAAAAATQDLDFSSSDRTADLPSSAIAAVLENGAWLSACSVPVSSSLDVCVAIQGGRVTAVTVVSQPADPALNACLKQRAAALQFPYSARVDIARTRF